MKYMRDRAWMEISLDAIEENYNRIKHDIGKSRIMAVVKANAYGLGASYLSLFLEKLGCDFFAVACIEEAMELRNAGVKADIPVSYTHLFHIPLAGAYRGRCGNGSQGRLPYRACHK